MVRDTETTRSSAVADPFAPLGETEKRVLSYAASIGKEFDFSVLSLAVEMEEEPLAETLEKLVHRGILKELKGGDFYAFVREETFAQAYREISSSRLRVIHKKIAEAYETLNPDPRPNIVPEMGRHYHLGKVYEKSLLYNRYAATQAMTAFSPDVAIHHLERAREDLAALPGDHKLEESDVLKEIGEQYDTMGDSLKAYECFELSLKKLPAEERTLRALLILSMANSAREMDKLGLACQHCEEAIKLLEKAGHKKGLALAHRTLCRIAFKQGHFEVGKREIEATIGFLDPVRDGKEVARCYIEFGNLCSIMQDSTAQAKAIEHYQKAIKTLEPLRDYHELARAHNNLAIAMGTSQPREVLKELTEAFKCAEKGGDKRFMGWALFNSVEFHLALGEEKEALHNNMEARKILSKSNDMLALEQITLNEAMIAQHRKSYKDSEKAYMEALKRADDLGYPQFVAEALLYLSRMYEEWGRNEDAIKNLSRMKAIGEDAVSARNRPDYEALKKRLGI
jgi:tetratricopeptide (TPR) repeat protein